MIHTHIYEGLSRLMATNLKKEVTKSSLILPFRVDCREKHETIPR